MLIKVLKMNWSEFSSRLAKINKKLSKKNIQNIKVDIVSEEQAIYKGYKQTTITRLKIVE